jgi:hypothetical protein
MVSHYATVFITDSNLVHVGLSTFLDAPDGSLVSLGSSDTKLSLDDVKNLRDKLNKVIAELDNA